MVGWSVWLWVAATVVGTPSTDPPVPAPSPTGEAAAASTPKPPELVPILYPADPIEAERIRGRDAYRKSRNVIRTFDRYRQSVGRWASGPVQRTVEDVLWLSPEWASRWLGYHEAKEKWPAGEVERRWGEIALHMEGRLLFVVRLSAFARHDYFGEIQAPADPTDLEPLRFLVTLNGHRLPQRVGPFGKMHDLSPEPDDPEPRWLECFAERVATLRSNDPESFTNVAWWRWLPFEAAVRPEFEPLGAPEGFLGEYRQDIYLVSVDLPTDTLANPESVRSVQVRIFSQRRERVGSFDLRRDPTRR